MARRANFSWPAAFSIGGCPSMVCIKTRYVVVRFKFEDGRRVSLETTLVPIIKSKLETNFGAHVLSMVGRLSMAKYLPRSQMAIVKCDVEACKYIVHSLVTIGELSNQKCSFKVLWVSGILKKAMRKTLLFSKKEQELAEKAFNG
jgi:RNase P/RNase MRP subunit POP5